MHPHIPCAAPGPELIACHECDTLHRIPVLLPGEVAHCKCCGSTLLRNPTGGLDRPFTLYITALILLIFANLFPFLTLDIHGRIEATTIIGASIGLYQAGMGELAVVVLITSVLGPGFLIASNLYVLLAVRACKPLPAARSLLAWVSHLKPWVMLDVFMLGVLVSFVKLAGMATMHIGISFYAFTGLIFVSAAATAATEPQLLWQRLGNLHEVRHAG